MFVWSSVREALPARAPRVDFAVVPCGRTQKKKKKSRRRKNTWQKPPAPNRGLQPPKKKPIPYPSWVKTPAQKREYRKDLKDARREQNMVNLGGFHKCIICQKMILKKPQSDEARGVQCRNRGDGEKSGCEAYFHKECTNGWLKNNSSCPACRTNPMFEGGPTEAPGAAAYRNEVMRIYEGEEPSAAAQAEAGTPLDPNDISASIVPYATNRVLDSIYFLAQPFLCIYDGDDSIVNVHPMWKTNEDHQRQVCGYYFLPCRVPDYAWWNGCVDQNTDAREAGVPNMLFHTLRRHEYRPQNSEDCGTVENVTQRISQAWSPVIELMYVTYDDRFSEWENDHERRWLLYIATHMRAKGLRQGGEDAVREYRHAETVRSFQNFEWGSEVDFVFMPEEGDFRRCIGIKPEKLAQYIREGGQLW